MPVLYIVLGSIVVLGIIYVVLYNKIIQYRNRCDNALQTIDTQLQRRFDLIPNVVETVKGYAKHESSVFKEVVEARNHYTVATSTQDKLDANNQITSALQRLFALAESYPQLQANGNFLSLQNELKDTENRISYARQSYNDCVLNYNNSIQTFPGNVVASISHFKTKEGFAVETSAAKEAPKVSF